MFKKFFGRKRSFRKVLTPVAAIVMLAQPAGNVIKAIPENIQVNADEDLKLNNGNVYLLPLTEFCQRTGGGNKGTIAEKLDHVRTMLGKEKNFKFGVRTVDGNFKNMKHLLLIDPESDNAQAVFGRVEGTGEEVAVALINETVKDIENDITDDAKQMILDEGLLANGENVEDVHNPVPNANVENVPVPNPLMNLVVPNADVENVHNPVPNANVEDVHNPLMNVNNEELHNVNNEKLPLLDVKGHNKKNNKKQKNQCNGVGIFTFMLGLATGVGGKMAYDGVVSQNNAGGDSEYSEGEIETRSGYESDETDADSDGDEE